MGKYKLPNKKKKIPPTLWVTLTFLAIGGICLVIGYKSKLASFLKNYGFLFLILAVWAAGTTIVSIYNNKTKDSFKGV